MANCSGLDAFRNFGDYTALLRDRTGYNETLLFECRADICSAVYGLGLPDLSGIGVVVGYLLSTLLGPLFTLLILVIPFRHARLQKMLAAGLATFFESAVYFAFAIQVATITTLAPKDWEAKSTSFGDYEVRVAGLVSVICLLPLLCPIALLSSVKTGGVTGNHRDDDNEAKARTSHRLTLFTITVILFCYPFVSQSTHNFAETQIGEGKGKGGATYVSDYDWDKVAGICYARLSRRDHNIIRAFQLLASLSILLFAIGVLVPAGLRRLKHNFPEKNARWEKAGAKLDDASRLFTSKDAAWLRYILIFVPTLLAVPLFWGFWKLRTIQKNLSEMTRGTYEGDEWGFGQVMAITIFLPVAAEMIFVRKRAIRDGSMVSDKHGGSERKD
ncbi:hypothetical protein QBC43DRAFT_112034 [Cladorrhinum sp. PSN259]|nr:hypothetical protein QBC43DRAFT_112034 [Cladorrhinum sp. PSN259]